MRALVTGACSGIGLEYARLLASHGYDLMVVSNRENEIFNAAKKLGEEYKVDVRPYYMNLAEENAADLIYHYCQEQDLQIDILINNAGVFFFNDLVKTDMKRIETMLFLHIHTVTKMCRLFGADMVGRKQGYILNMSSMSAWMSMPGINVYNATKAYILNFSKSLWYEMRPYGVTVTAVCPGAIDTGLYGLSDKWRRVAVKLGVSMPPAKLAKKGLKAMFAEKKCVVPGAINKPFVFLIKHLPDWVVFKVMKKIDRFHK